MKSTDYLIWIGQSYSSVLCRRKKSTCANPFIEVSSHCYIHEAEWRGCCRKVPLIPKLAITGRTRIFLAHKDGLRNKELGRIFGYYILKGIEIIKGVSRPLSMPMQNFKMITTPHGMVVRGEGWNGKKLETSKVIDDRLPMLEPRPECEEGAIKEKECSDGSFITTHVCVDGNWKKTNAKCDDNGEEDGCENGAFQFQSCNGGGYVISHVCVNGKWEKTDAECPKPNPPEQTMFEPERACSLRLKPRSIYLVDALARDITANFKYNLKDDGLIEDYMNAKTELEKEEFIKRGRKLFVDSVTNVKLKRNIYTKIPEELTNRAELQGEFVLFNKRTIFEKYPSASFRGIMGIDGDKIIEQVSKGKARIDISYCDEKWPAKLSQNTKSSKSYIERFLKHLIKIAKEELKSNEDFKIPGFGRFYIEETKEKLERKSSTGDTSVIPKKRRVRFIPYKNLKNITENGS